MTRLIVIAVVLSVLYPPAVVAQADDPAFTLRNLPATDGFTPGGRDFDFLEAQAVAGAGEPSMTKAVLYSLLLPGLGDYYAGRTHRARYFFIAEAAIWTSFAVFRIQGHEDEEAYENVAVQFAGIEGTGHSDDFYAELREWNSSAEYEAFLKAAARPELFPDVGYVALEGYFEANRVSDFQAWEWESRDRRLQFAELRSASKAAYRHSMFSIAAAGVNRLVSAIFAYQAVKSDREDRAQSRYRIEFGTPPEYDAAVSIVRSF